MLWHNSPKSKRVGQKSLKVSTALAVLAFNDGSMSLAIVSDALGLSLGYNSLKFLTQRDHTRNLARVRRITKTHKRRRRQVVKQTELAEKAR